LQGIFGQAPGEVEREGGHQDHWEGRERQSTKEGVQNPLKTATPVDNSIVGDLYQHIKKKKKASWVSCMRRIEFSNSYSPLWPISTHALCASRYQT